MIFPGGESPLSPHVICIVHNPLSYLSISMQYVHSAGIVHRVSKFVRCNRLLPHVRISSIIDHEPVHDIVQYVPRCFTSLHFPSLIHTYIHTYIHTVHTHTHIHTHIHTYIQDLKPSNVAVNEDCELRVSEGEGEGE